MDGGGISACAHGLLKPLNESFDKTIGRRMVGSAADVLDTITSKEVGGVLAGELRTVVLDHLLRKTMASKNRSKTVNGPCSSRAYHRNNFGPFRASVNNQQEHAVHEWAGEIDVYTLPWACRPFPWMQWRAGRLPLMQLTSTAGGDSRFDVTVYSWPPYIAAGGWFHAHYAWCPECNSSRTRCSRHGGTITLLDQSRHPCDVVS